MGASVCRAHLPTAPRGQPSGQLSWKRVIDGLLADLPIRDASQLIAGGSAVVPVARVPVYLSEPRVLYRSLQAHQSVTRQSTLTEGQQVLL